VTITVHHGDSREILKGIPDASVHSVVTDPPYALVSISKRFGKADASPAKAGKTGAYARASAGFMGKKWDTGETAFDPAFWAEVLRVLKPGGYVVAFGGTRTYHRLACAIEDAGFEIRDQIAWIYGSGFPKSHDVSKGIDKALGAERRVVAKASPVKRMIPGADQNKGGWEKNNGREFVPTVTAAGSPEAAAWEGWGTALKPALEPIVLARKPLDGTVAANVLEHGTGALNIEECRVEGVGNRTFERTAGDRSREQYRTGTVAPGTGRITDQGRWPANVIHDRSDEVVEAFPEAPGPQADISTTARSPKTSGVYGKMNREGEASAGRRYTDRGSTDFAPLPGQRRGDSGSAARFFYSAKADAEDRLGSKHPTVKPVDLMAYLCRLVTPPGGTVLDPFAGTGTTGLAAMREGFDCILIEREAEYVADIHRRIAWATGEGRLTIQEMSRKADEPVDPLPLFAGSAA